jgi:hypothetical protein
MRIWAGSMIAQSYMENIIFRLCKNIRHKEIVEQVKNIENEIDSMGYLRTSKGIMFYS